MGSSLSQFATALGLTEPLRVLYTHRGTGASGAVDLRDPYAIIGRSAQCGVCLNDASVSKKHVYLQAIGDRCFVLDLNSRLGIRLAGADVTQGWLARGDTLQVGEYAIRVAGSTSGQNLPSLPPTALGQSDRPPTLALVMRADAAGHYHCPVRHDLTVIGRHEACNLKLQDERLSSYHAAIVQSANDAWLIDLLGVGGTRLNDRMVRRSRLNVGDRISLNGVQLEVGLNRTGDARPDRRDTELATTTPAPAATDLTSEIRQLTLMMAKLYTAMHQEQTAAMNRQNELLEQLLGAVQNGHQPNGTHPALNGQPVAGQPIPLESVELTPPPPQIPKPGQPTDEAALAEAHKWFMDRLDKIKSAKG